MVSWGDRTRERALLLVAHRDSGTGGLATHDGVRRRLAWLPGSPWAGLCWLMAGVLIVLPPAAGRYLGLGARPGAVPGHRALLAALPLLLGLAPVPATGGENDNASGVALALRLADQAQSEHFGVHVLLTGSQKAFAHGMRAFMLRHGGGLDRERTIVLNLDTVGHGRLATSRREGPVKAVRSHFQLVELCAGGRGFRRGGPRLGRAAGTDRRLRRPDGGSGGRDITCRDERGYASRRLTERSLTWSEAFCLEVIRRLDAEVGEDP